MKNILTLLFTLALSLPAAAAGLGGGLFGPPRRPAAVVFANLGAPLDGDFRWCSDCTPTLPCGSGGTGAFAYRVGAAWNCNEGSGFNAASITGQTAETSADAADLLLIYDDSAAALRKMTRANFLAIGTDVQAWDADLDTFAAAGMTGTGAFVRADSSTLTTTVSLTGGTSPKFLIQDTVDDANDKPGLILRSPAAASAGDWVFEVDNSGNFQLDYTPSGGAEILFTDSTATNSAVTIAGTLKSPSIAAGANNADGTGALQVQMGSSSANAKVGGSEWYSVTEIGNVGTGEDALIPAETIEAASLTNDGSSILFRVVGSTANNANVKRIRVRLIEGANNNVIYDAGASAIITNSDWVLECEVIRESATLFKSACSISTTGVSGLAYADFATGTYTFANAGTIAVTAEATTDNDVVMEAWKGRWYPAP